MAEDDIRRKLTEWQIPYDDDVITYIVQLIENSNDITESREALMDVLLVLDSVDPKRNFVQLADDLVHLTINQRQTLSSVSIVTSPNEKVINHAKPKHIERKATYVEIRDLPNNIAHKRPSENALDQAPLVPLDFLQSIFPSIEQNSLAEFLKESSYDIEKCVISLLQQRDAENEYTIDTSQNELILDDKLISQSVASVTRICRHYFAGACYRKDCQFSHDEQKVVCKYYLRGLCTKGDQCTFVHHVNSMQLMSSLYDGAAENTNDSIDPLRDDVFPSLTSNYKAPSFLSQSYRDVASQQKTPVTSPVYSSFSLYKSPLPGNIKKRVFERVPRAWLDTGRSLEILYTKHRELAIETAKQRNKLFQQAAEAFRKGDKVYAGQLAKEGRKLDDKMQDKHLVAARAIFAERNASFGDRTDVIDLHGLHVSEALDFLYEYIENRRSIISGSIDIFYVIFGTGHHSKHTHLGRHSQSARLMPAVLEFLEVNFPSATVIDCSPDSFCGMIGVVFS